MFQVALIGNPNCGKTTIFNNLTGSQAHVGNWPGVTVEKREGVYKKKKDFPEDIDIVDLPGIYSLSPYTPEEVVSRNFLIDSKPDAVINVIDSTNLARNLFLTTQLLEMDIPVVIALNFMDVLDKKGDTIDITALSKSLGVPVVPVSALKTKGMQDLVAAAFKLKGTTRKGQLSFVDPSILAACKVLVPLVEAEKISSPLFIASKLLEEDSIVTDQYQLLAKKAHEIVVSKGLATSDRDLESVIADDRYCYIEKQLYPCYHRLVKAPKISFSDRVDKILTNRFLGLPIFALIMYVMFSIVFDNDFLKMGAMGLGPVRPFFEEQTPGMPSLGILLQDTLDWVLNHWLVGLISNGLTAASAPAWVTSLICDGLLNAVFTVVTYLPLIILLTLFIQILENSGYMARVAFVFDRLLRRFGISGRCVVPLISCFGCAVPGIMGTRTIDNQREKVLTISLTPFFSCGAKLPIYMGVGTKLISVLTGGAIDGGLTAFILYAIGIVVAILAGYFSNRFIIQGDSSPFIMEFPPYLVPQFKSTMLALWDETKRFLKRAGTVIALMSLLLWFLTNFSWNWQLVSTLSDGTKDIESSIIYSIGVFIQPIFYPLGFGKGADGWKYIIAAFTGVIAKEQVVATMESLGILKSGLAASDINISLPAIFSFLTYNLLSLPCIAAISTAKGELKSKKNFHYVLAFWLVVSYVVSFIVYGIGSLSFIGSESYTSLELSVEIVSLVFVVAIVLLFVINHIYRLKKGQGIHLFSFRVDDPNQSLIKEATMRTDTDSGDRSFLAQSIGASDAGKEPKNGHSCHCG
jgi:ferrous iron transport protein B